MDVIGCYRTRAELPKKPRGNSIVRHQFCCKMRRSSRAWLVKPLTSSSASVVNYCRGIGSNRICERSPDRNRYVAVLGVGLLWISRAKAWMISNNPKANKPSAAMPSCHAPYDWFCIVRSAPVRPIASRALRS
jgi:hypothetical protein